jgi:hypothetical protein
MEDENITNVPSEEEENIDQVTRVVDRLEQLSKGAASARLAAVASNGVEEKSALQMKPTDPGQTNELVDDSNARKDPLRKNFETLAKFHRDFKHFGSTKALDDPVSYLREVAIDIKGRPKYKVSNAQLEDAIQVCLWSGRGGLNSDALPLATWADQYKQSSAIGQAFQAGLKSGMFGDREESNTLSKALDTGGGTTSGGPLIRVDVDPLLREVYLRKFPLFDMIRKFPANGLVHTFVQRTAAGTAALVDELGSLSATESASTYTRQATSHIAVLAAQRQISLKLQYAVAQSGMSFDLSGGGNLEITGALGEIARLDQSLICQGNYSSSGKTASDEEGAYNALGFDGLRIVLKESGTSINKATSDTYARVINRATADIINSGGDVDNLVILCSLYAKMDIEEELVNFLRLPGVPAGGFPSNMATNGLVTVADTLTRLMPIPAAAQTEGLGYYTYNAASTEDLIVTDPSGIGLAFLGSPTPQVLELPVGFNNALSNVYIPFVMHGLTVFVIPFNRKIRIAQVTE